MRKRRMTRRRVMRKLKKNIKRLREQEGNYTCVTDWITIHSNSYWPFFYNSSVKLPHL